MINAFFDEKMEVRKGDRISILRGIETDMEIRITLFENLSSGVIQKSRINGTLMTRSAHDFDPPIHGKIETIEIKSSGTYITLKEGIYTPEELFIEAGEKITGATALRDIFSNEISKYVKICDAYISEDTLELLENLPKSTNTMILCHTIQNKGHFSSKVKELKGKGINIEIRTVKNKKDIHDRYILTYGEGWWVGHSIKDFGLSDSHFSKITDCSTVENTFDKRWKDAVAV